MFGLVGVAAGPTVFRIGVLGLFTNIYCDESCHLENDGHDAMVLGGVFCPADHVKRVALDLRAIKERHGVSRRRELKWIKVSPAKADLYSEVIGYFFANDHLRFRGLLVANKSSLRHDEYGQTHDDWYYKMYYFLLVKPLQNPLTEDERFRIYLDIKDTHSNPRALELQSYLCAKLNDHEHAFVERVQAIRSHEAELLQLTDLLIGAIGYKNRGITTSETKLSLVAEVQERSGSDLTHSSPYSATKFDVFSWKGEAAT